MSYRIWAPIFALHIPAPITPAQEEVAANLCTHARERGAFVEFTGDRERIGRVH